MDVEPLQPEALPAVRGLDIPQRFYQVLRTRGGYTEVQYGLVAAMGVLYLLPVMAIFFAMRRLMVRGLISTSRGL